MKEMKLSFCYHPTTVLFVDDDMGYLKKVVLSYGELMACVPFQDPIQALKALEASKYENLEDRCLKEPQDNEYDRVISEIEISKIVDVVHCPERFEEIAIVVVDYSMPSMTGIEFCVKARRDNLFFILLTGEADNEIAIKAFNQGIIHGFIKKSSANANEEVLQTILNLQERYFLNMSKSMLGNRSQGHFDFLKNDQIRDFFRNFCHDNQVVEYYLLSQSGDFLLLNKHAEISFLSMKSTKEIQKLYEAAKFEKAPQALLESLKNKAKMPLFYDAEDTDPAPNDWEPYLEKCQSIPNKDDFYFAYRKKPSAEGLKKFKGIYAYDAYLSKL